MKEVMEAYPGAQRALFRRYHIGGCSSCAFEMSESVANLCQRNGELNVKEVLDHLEKSHQDDEQLLITGPDLKQILDAGQPCKILDIRSREEFEAVNISNSVLMTQDSSKEIMAYWKPDDLLVIVDHLGQQSLDAASYFLGHGLKKVRCLRGGIDAWSQQVDPSLRRYRFGS